MWPDRESNPGRLTNESGALPIALRGPARTKRIRQSHSETVAVVTDSMYFSVVHQC